MINHRDQEITLPMGSLNSWFRFISFGDLILNRKSVLGTLLHWPSLFELTFRADIDRFL